MTGDVKRDAKNTNDLGEWFPVTMWPRRWPTIAGLRQRVSALDRAGVPVPFIRHLGRLMLVSLAQWDAWLANQATEKPSTGGQAERSEVGDE